MRTTCRTTIVVTTTAMLLLQAVSSAFAFGCECQAGEAYQETASNTSCCCSSRTQSDVEHLRKAAVHRASCCRHAQGPQGSNGDGAACSCHTNHQQPATPQHRDRLIEIANPNWLSLTGSWADSPINSVNLQLSCELPRSQSADTAFAQKVYCTWLT